MRRSPYDLRSVAAAVFRRRSEGGGGSEGAGWSQVTEALMDIQARLDALEARTRPAAGSSGLSGSDGSTIVTPPAAFPGARGSAAVEDSPPRARSVKSESVSDSPLREATVIRASSQPPTLSTISESDVRSFKLKWVSHLATLAGSEPGYGPLDMLEEAAAEQLKSLIATGSVKSTIVEETRTASEHLDAIDALATLAASGKTWHGALDDLRRVYLPKSATANTFVSSTKHGLPRFIALLERARAMDDRNLPSDKVYVKIFLDSFLRKHSVISRDIRDTGISTLQEAYAHVQRILAIQESANRFAKIDTKTEDETKDETKTPAKNNRTSLPKSKCFACGKVGHRYTECRSEPGPWKWVNGKLTHQTDPSKKAAIPAGLAAPREANAVAAGRPLATFMCGLRGCRADYEDVEVLFDTGSEINIVSQDTLERVAAGEEFDNTAENFSTVGGGFQTTGSASLFLRVEHACLPRPVVGQVLFKVVPTLSRTIISYSTITSLGLAPLLLHDATSQLPATERRLVATVSSIPHDYLDDDIEFTDNSLPPALPTVAVGRPRRSPTPTPEDTFPNDPVQHVLEHHGDIFSEEIPSTPCTLPALKFQLKDGYELPKPPKARRWPPAQQKVIDDQVKMLRRSGVIRTSTSPVASPVLVVPKPKQPGKFRFCIDMRKINDIILLPANPMPRQQDLIESFAGAVLFASLDLTQAYFQFELHESSRMLSAFHDGKQLYEFNRVTQGAKPSPPHVNGCLVELFRDHPWVKVYYDDLGVTANSRLQLASRLHVVLTTLKSVGLYLNPSKCRFAEESATYLGMSITGSTVSPTLDRARAIQAVPVPTTKSQVRSFLGAANFLRHFVENFSTIAEPLHAITGKKQFTWGEPQGKAFQDLKDAITSAPALHHFNPSKMTILRTDASATGYGAVLLQADLGTTELLGDNLEPVAYFSGKWSDCQSRWSPNDQESAAVVLSIEHFDYYLRHRRFILQTDHANLLYMSSSQTDKILRHHARLLKYDFEVQHVPGRLNAMADMLSRLHDKSAEVNAVGSTPTGSEPPASDPYDGWSEGDFRKIVSIYHNTIGGHHGAARTELLLRADGYDWPSLSTDVAAYVRECETCQATDPRVRRFQSVPFGSLNSFEPFISFSIDMQGPHPEDHLGRRYSISAVDDFHRFLELGALSSLSAVDIARFLITLFGRYGAPVQVRIDNQTSLVGKVNAELFRIMGSNIIRCVPHNHRTNGIVERCHREINRHLRAILYDRPELLPYWSDLQPLAQRVINAAPAGSTGVPPVVVQYAGQVTPNRRLFAPVPPSVRKSKGPSSFLDAIGELQEKLLAADDKYMRGRMEEYNEIRQEMARHINEAATEEQRRVLRKRTDKLPEPDDIHRPSVGDLVTLEYPDRPPTKFSPSIRGPFKVAMMDKNIATLSSLINDSIRRVDVARLRPWKGTSPAEAARRAEPAHFEVDYIVDYGVKTSCKRKNPKASDYTFQVHWKGYDAADRTWQSLSSVQHLDAFKDFIRGQQEAPPCLAALAR